MGTLALIPEEVDDAILAMIATGNNTRRARTLLEAAGKRVPSASTLHGLPQTHGQRFLELQTKHAPQIAERIAGQAEALTLAYTDLQAQVIERFSTELPTLDAKELSGAARNLATAAALNVDKLASPLRGRPTVIHAQDDPVEAGKRLMAKLGITWDTTATDMDPPEPSEKPLPNRSESPNAHEHPVQTDASTPPD
jgi:hypothetical protein